MEQVTLTTNGVLLEKQAGALKRAGVDCINVSLDTLDPRLYRQITGQDALEKVVAGILQAEKLDIPVTVITQVDCIPDHYKNDINGKIIAINPAVLKPEYQRADRQLYLVTGGFGASANARGSAVFCRNLYDGKDTRYERMDVLGEVKPERMPDWAKEKAAAFSRTIQGKDHER